MTVAYVSCIMCFPEDFCASYSVLVSSDSFSCCCFVMRS
uniref:Uncharacterized protein n=1 Tax=Rhizophora mucronata TaxID=61149 RepID=A0A2P2QSU3_RHIMU